MFVILNSEVVTFTSQAGSTLDLLYFWIMYECIYAKMFSTICKICTCLCFYINDLHLSGSRH